MLVMGNMLHISNSDIPEVPRLLRRITAAGLSRVLDHMWKGPFGILSASMVELDAVENKSRTGELKEILKSQGYGFIDLQGGYLYEAEGKPKTPVKEDSVFIPNISDAAIKELSELFEQESYVFGEQGQWVLKETKSGAAWAEGLVEDTFEALRHQTVDEDHPYMSQMRGNKGTQFRLDEGLIERRKLEQERIMQDQRSGRVAFRLVGVETPCFYSIAGVYQPRPPVHLHSNAIMMNGKCPAASLLDCWLPLQEV